MDSRKTRENARAKRLEELTKEFLGEATATAQSGEDYSEVLRMLKEKHPSSFVDSFIKKVEEAQKRAERKELEQLLKEAYDALHSTERTTSELLQLIKEKYSSPFSDSITKKIDDASKRMAEESFDDARKNRPDIELLPPEVVSTYLLMRNFFPADRYAIQVDEKDWDINPDYSLVSITTLKPQPSNPAVYASIIFSKKDGHVATRKKVEALTKEYYLSKRSDYPDYYDLQLYGLEIKVDVGELDDGMGRAFLNHLKGVSSEMNLLKRITVYLTGYGMDVQIFYKPQTEEEAKDEKPEEFFETLESHEKFLKEIEEEQ